LSTNINSYTKQQHKRDRSSNFSDILKQNAKEKISEPSQDPVKFTYTTSSQNSLISLNFSDLQAYGYTVDKADFMGADFNKAAGLPQDFKIHKSTLDELSRFAERNHVLNRIKSKDEQIKIFDNIDMADTIKHYYRLFDQMTSALAMIKKATPLQIKANHQKATATKATNLKPKDNCQKHQTNLPT
ncbi:Cj0814 family flagellar-dependent secreted protein, partial [Campylobacter concisus]|uniref:Cj0814 family flagellar-dependent secreted protein n=1 Tax=Campylobacter concisus TaxID=199 RepID=UPI003D30290B